MQVPCASSFFVGVLFFRLFVVGVVAQSEPPFDRCDAGEYYADLLVPVPDVTFWTKNDVANLITNTQRRSLVNVANVIGEDDILTALVDLFPGESEDTVRLVYRDIDVPAVPRATPNSWNRGDLWPLTRGIPRSPPALTDVHGKVPADSTVLSVKSDLFFGECNTVQARDACQTPATIETAIDTQQDGTIFAPPRSYRGSIARALFYTELRYAATLNLTLTDCPPFGATDFGYLSALLQWHQDFPPTAEEIARNDRACSRWQGNRNPFVDFPVLATVFFGVPDTIVPETMSYSSCPAVPTPSPTAVPNACSFLRPGDLPIVLFNSDDPDQIIFYALADLEADVEFLFVTDNAWNGSALFDNEGTYRFSIPEKGVAAGESFGFGENSSLSENWELFGDFELDTDGDQVFIYCLDADNLPNFLWGLSYNGAWVDTNGTEDSAYGTNSSALPESLEILGNTVLNHSDNCVYRGALEGRKTELQAQFMDPTNFICFDGIRIGFELGDGNETELPTGIPSEMPSRMPTELPSEVPTGVPTGVPSEAPSEMPTAVPSEIPTAVPSEMPTAVPSEIPTGAPTRLPSDTPSEMPTSGAAFVGFWSVAAPVVYGVFVCHVL